MSDKKNTKQDEQNLLHSNISSREVGARSSSAPPKSAYDRLVDEIKLSHPEPISDQNAHRLARGLMEFCRILIDVGIRQEDENSVDKQGVNGNVGS